MGRVHEAWLEELHETRLLKVPTAMRGGRGFFGRTSRPELQTNARHEASAPLQACADRLRNPPIRAVTMRQTTRNTVDRLDKPSSYAASKVSLLLLNRASSKTFSAHKYHSNAGGDMFPPKAMPTTSARKPRTSRIS